jgi:hypothetical protein
MLDGGGDRRHRVALQHVLLLLVHVSHVPAAAHTHPDSQHYEEYEYQSQFCGFS